MQRGWYYYEIAHFGHLSLHIPRYSTIHEFPTLNLYKNIPLKPRLSGELGELHRRIDNIEARHSLSYQFPTSASQGIELPLIWTFLQTSSNLAHQPTLET